MAEYSLWSHFGGLGSDGVAKVPVSAAAPLPITGSLTATQTGAVSRPTITVSASPDYAQFDVVGGIITLTSIMASTGREAILKSITLKDASFQGPALSFLFFRATPTGGTYTDNAAVVFGATDLGNLCGVARVIAADWYTITSKASLVSLAGIDQLMQSATTDLYMLIIADAAWNAAATTDLTAEFGFEQR